MARKLNFGRAKPLPQAPFSNQALKMIYFALIELGMSEPAARGLASGEFEGAEMTDVLDEEDFKVFTDWLSGMKFE